MKTLLLAFVIGSLAATLICQRQVRRTEPRRIQAPSRVLNPSRAPSPDAHTSSSAPAGSAAAREVAAFTTPWQALEAGDLPGFVQALRNSGCPEESLRLFAVAAVGRPIVERLEAPLREDVRNAKWWREPLSPASRDLGQRIRQAKQELDRTLADLVGVPATELREEFLGTASDDRSWLPADLKARFLAQQSLQAVEIGEIESRALPGTRPTASEELRSELASARARHREELRVLLGPEVYANYEVRDSPEAQYVRTSLPEARNEAEFRLMVRAATEVGAQPSDLLYDQIDAQEAPKGSLSDQAPRMRDRVLDRFRELNSPEGNAELDQELAAEEQRTAETRKAQAQRSALEHLQTSARLGGAELTLEEARLLAAALEKRSAELEREWGAPPASPTEAERAALEERVAKEFESVAVSTIGEKGRAVVIGMKQEQRQRR